MRKRMLFALLFISPIAHANLIRWDWTGTIGAPYESTCNDSAPLFDLCEAVSGQRFHGSWIFEGDDLVPGAQAVTTTGGFSIIVDDVFALLYVGDLSMSTSSGSNSGFFYFREIGDGQFVGVDLLDHDVVTPAWLSTGFISYGDLNSLSGYDFGDLNPPPIGGLRSTNNPEAFIEGISIDAATAGLPINVESWVRVPVNVPEPGALSLLGAGLVGTLLRRRRRTC